MNIERLIGRCDQWQVGDRAGCRTCGGQWVYGEQVPCPRFGPGDEHLSLVSQGPAIAMVPREEMVRMMLESRELIARKAYTRWVALALAGSVAVNLWMLVLVVAGYLP